MKIKEAISLCNQVDNEGYTAEDVDSLTECIRFMARRLTEAPKFFAVDSFDGEKLAWLKKVGLVK